MKLTLRALCAASTLPFLLGACTDDDPGPSVGAKGAELVRAESCGDLLTQIQQDAIAKLDQQVEYLKDSFERSGGKNGGGLVITPDAGQDSAGDGDAAPSDGFGRDVAQGSADGPSNESDDEGPTSHSDTNIQVKDVDEADIVKVSADGERMYVLHGTEFKIIDAWPAAQAHEVGAVEVTGIPYELFVEGDRAIVFSRVAPNGINEKGSGATDCPDCCYAQSFVQIGIYDVSGAAPELEREMIFEGDYVSARRYDSTVRMVVRGGFAAHDLYEPNIDTYDSFGRPKSQERIEQDLEAWRKDVEADILASTLEDWIPRAYQKVGQEWEPLAEACDGYYIPAPGSVRSGVTRVVTFDIESAAAPGMTSILGGAEVVYSSVDTMVVTQTDWSWQTFEAGSGSKTSVHTFAIDGANTTYQASGYAPGQLENQFSVHESDGVVFLSTTEHSEKTGWQPRNTILSMQKGEDRSLGVVDRTDAMGEPGETIFATRFLGDRAYVVTFRQTDPLYAVDISDPADLTILGELHIPGFSEYIHPLGDDHLLTIGMETGGVRTGDDGGTGDGPLPVDVEPEDEPIDQEPEFGVALQIFDVSDATAPKLVHKKVLNQSNYSEALYNHKAFTFVDDYFGDDQSLLMFPLTGYDNGYRVSLEVAQVSVADGLTLLGSIEHSAIFQQNCEQQGDSYCHYGKQMRRGVQIDEYVYALGEDGLSVHALSSLDEPVAQLPFEALSYRNHYCEYEYIDEPTRGVEGAGEGGASGDGDVSGDASGDGDASSDDDRVDVEEMMPSEGVDTP